MPSVDRTFFVLSDGAVDDDGHCSNPEHARDPARDGEASAERRRLEEVMIIPTNPVPAPMSPTTVVGDRNVRTRPTMANTAAKSGRIPRNAARDLRKAVRVLSRSFADEMRKNAMATVYVIDVSVPMHLPYLPGTVFREPHCQGSPRPRVAPSLPGPPCQTQTNPPGSRGRVVFRIWQSSTRPKRDGRPANDSMHTQTNTCAGRLP
ncbi:MAG: hypothetical protein PWR07_532 [Bacillota bacterium]|nr:hypothetical protein [Bacillota bacterium]